MKKSILFALLPVLAGCSNVRTIGYINETEISRVTARGLFSPSSTVIVASNPEEPGIEVIAAAEQPGTLNAVATAGGLVGAAAVLRPARSSTSSTSGGGSSSATGGSASAKGGDSTAVNISSNSSKSSSEAVSVSSSAAVSSSKANNVNLNVNKNQENCPPKGNKHRNDNDD